MNKTQRHFNKSTLSVEEIEKRREYVVNHYLDMLPTLTDTQVFYVGESIADIEWVLGTGFENRFPLFQIKERIKQHENNK